MEVSGTLPRNSGTVLPPSARETSRAREGRGEDRRDAVESVERNREAMLREVDVERKAGGPTKSFHPDSEIRESKPICVIASIETFMPAYIEA
jgi:hypothetical protein